MPSRNYNTALTRQIVVSIAAIIIAGLGTWQAIRVTEISAKLNDREREISTLDTQLVEKDNEISTLKTQIDTLNNKISALEDSAKKSQMTKLQDLLSQQGKIQLEWQWAGENWYGRIDLQQQGNSYAITRAKVGLLEKNIEDRFLMNGQVLNLEPNTFGTFELTDNGIRIELPVLKKDRRSNEVKLTTMQGTLNQTLCYAGRILYRDSGGQYQGDMVLVNYVPLYASQLDDWFLNEQPWSNMYYVDR